MQWLKYDHSAFYTHGPTKQKQKTIFLRQMFFRFLKSLQSELKVTDTRLAVSKDCGCKV